MFPYQRVTLAVCASMLLFYATQPTALGTPQLSSGMHCAACHNEASPDLLTINGNFLTGDTETFQSMQGETVQLSFTITLPANDVGPSPNVYRSNKKEEEDEDEDEHGQETEIEYILGIGGLELADFNPKLDSMWEHRLSDLVSYVLKDDYEENHSFTLDVGIDVSMPVGDYEMFAVAAGVYEEESSSGDENHAMWSITSPFILRVTSTIPEPSTMGLLLILVGCSLGIRFRR